MRSFEFSNLYVASRQRRRRSLASDVTLASENVLVPRRHGFQSLVTL